MRKQIAIASLLLALTPFIYGDFTVSGIVTAGTTFASGSSEDSDVINSAGFIMGRLQATGQNEDNTFGGLLRIKVDGNAVPYAWAWWKPVEQARIQLGFIDSFGVANIVGWEFHENDAEDYIASAGYEYSGAILDRGSGFYTGTYWNGASLSITPFYGLNINAAIPVALAGGYMNLNNAAYSEAGNSYQYLHAQVTYTLDWLGRAALTFTGNGNGKLNNQWYDTTDLTSLDPDNFRSEASTLYASFYLIKPENIDLNIGFSYTLPAKDSDTGVSYYAPIGAGLGFHFKQEEFTFSARLAGNFLGSIKDDNGHKAKDGLKLGFGILPSYDFGAFRLYFNTGVSCKWADEELTVAGNLQKVDYSSALAWHVNPYITKRIGAGTFYGGVRVESDGVKTVKRDKSVIQWGVPVAIQFEF